MKILIVNGYSKTSAGIQNFSDFQYFIQKVLKEQKEMVDTETEFFIRDKENLDDFLYELDSSYVKKDAAKLFDHLDMIFVTGDSNLLPWHASACKNITIVNGRGKGGKIGQFNSLDKDIKDLKPTDYFLDHITGDLYAYNYENEEWVAKANTGLHFQKAAQEFHSIGKFIIQAPVYRPKSVTDSLKNIYVSRNTEIIGYLKKIHLHHWALNEMSMEFLVPFKNSWFVHSFAFTNKSKKFDILAESEKGPIVVEFKNIIATQFEIDPKYPETHIPLKNFILFQLRKIKTYNKSSEALILTYYNATKNYEILIQLAESLKGRNAKRTFKLFEEEGKNNKFTHAGMAMKRHGNSFIVDQNVVTDKTYKMKKKPVLEKNSEKTNEKNNEKKHDIFSSKKPETPKNRPFSQYNTTKNSEKRAFFFEAEKFEHNFDRILHEFGNENVVRNGSEGNIFKKAEVRNLLHPKLATELLNNEDLWVPGKYSELKKIYEQKKVIRLKSANFLNGNSSKIQRNLLTAQRTLMTKNLFSPMSPINPKTPYVEFEKQKRWEERQEAGKEIGPKFYVGKPRQIMIKEDYLPDEDAKYQPISGHKFREESKGRWVGNAFRF